MNISPCSCILSCICLPKNILIQSRTHQKYFPFSNKILVVHFGENIFMILRFIQKKFSFRFKAFESNKNITFQSSRCPQKFIKIYASLVRWEREKVGNYQNCLHSHYNLVDVAEPQMLSSLWLSTESSIFHLKTKKLIKNYNEKILKQP